MAYLVRRLLENTSNEGFLANKFAKGASREALLRSPHESPAADATAPALTPHSALRTPISITSRQLISR